jgi:hypothetical protein
MPIWIEQDPEYLKKLGLSGAFTEYVGELEEREPKKIGQSVIVLGRHPRGETVAHEIGHAALKHQEEDFLTPEDMARNEVAAWAWAHKKRSPRQGGRIRSNFVTFIALQLKKWFPDITLDETIDVIERAFEVNNVEPPSPDYIRNVVEAVDEEVM